MRRLFRLLLPFGVLALLAIPSTATAMHSADLHSANITKLFESPNLTGATNSDIAFWGNRAFVGNYDGVRIYDIANPAAPVLLSDFRCHGPQNDPAVWGNLLFLAIDRTQSGPNCGSTDVAHDAPTGWEGVRIFDVSNPAAPTQVGAVYSDCGAHTITLNPVGVNTIHLWVSSYPLRPGPTCGPVRGVAAGRDPLHGVIQVIEVPLNNPAGAREIAEPPINYPGDPDNKWIAAERDFAGFLDMRACHDITIHVALKIATAACAEQAQVWRIGANGIPNTANPLWVYDETADSDGPGGGDTFVDFWHSATFSWDGKLVNVIDESFGSGCPTVTQIGAGPTKVPSDTGWMYFLDARTGAKLSDMRMERPEPADAPGSYCSAHLGNVAPTVGKYHLMNAWYTGGLNVVDFTNPRSPTEIAFWDWAPAGSAGSDTWSHYWYENRAGDDNGYWLWANDIGRGFAVFRATMPAVDVALTRLNPQTQEDVIRCRVSLTPGSLRAGQARTVQARVTIAPGRAIVPGQTVRGVTVRFRGPGVSVNTTTNGGGLARVSGVAASSRGRLTASVRTVPNMLGCSDSVRVAAARAGGVGPALTGRPR